MWEVGNPPVSKSGMRILNKIYTIRQNVSYIQSCTATIIILIFQEHDN